MTIIKLALSIIYFIITLLCLGHYICDRFPKINQLFHYKLPIGFITFLAIYQLLIYPAQLFHFPNIYLSIIFILLSLGSIVLGFKKINYQIYNKKELLLILLLICFSLLLFTMDINNIGLLGNGNDETYYFGFIQENAKLFQDINNSNPIIGGIGTTSNTYVFSGVFHLLSAISITFTVSSHLISIWLTFILLNIIAYLNAFNISKLAKNVTMRNIIILFSILTISTGFSIADGTWPIFFGRICNMLTYIVISFYLITTSSKFIKDYYILYLLCSLAYLSCQSTNFFLLAILIIPFCLFYVLQKKQFNIHCFTLVAFPVLLYAIHFVIYDNLYLIPFVLLLIIIVFLINLLYKYQKKIFTVKLFYILLIAIACLTLSSPMFISNSSIVSVSNFYNSMIYQSSPELNITTMVGLVIYEILIFLIITTLVIFHSKNTFVRFISVIVFTTLLIFFNPLSINFTATYITGEVEYRLLRIFLSEIVIFTVLSLIINDKTKYIIYLAISLLFAEKIIVFPKNLYNDINNLKTSNIIYKVDSEIYLIANWFDTNIEQNTTVLTTRDSANVKLLCDKVILSPSSYTYTYHRTIHIPNYENIFINDDPDKYNLALSSPDYYFSDYSFIFEDNFDVLYEIQTLPTDYIITNNWARNESNSHYYEWLYNNATIHFETENYRIISFKK